MNLMTNITIIILVLGLIFVYYMINSSSRKKNIYINKIQKLELKNGINCLLVHNPKFKTTVIRVQIKAGSIYNPIEVPGLVSLLKNVIIQGSTKYWKKEPLQARADDNLGCTTGYLSFGEISFELQISDSSVEKGADMLAWSISSPLFEKELVDKEIKVCDEYFKFSKTNEDFIENEVTKLIFDSDYSENKFFIGNKETLSVEDIVDKLKDFHSKYVTGDRINIVISSKLPFKKQENVLKLFEVIPTKNASLKLPSVSYQITDRFKNKMIKYTDTKNYGKMCIKIPFRMPSKDLIYKPIEYLFLLLAERKENSLIKILGAKINQLYLTIYNIEDYYTVSINLILSATGASVIEDNIKDIHRFLSSQLPMKSIFDEAGKFNYSFDSKVGNDELEASFYGHTFFDNYPLIIFGDRVNSYDENVLNHYLDIFGNINNWTILISTPESMFKNEIKYSKVMYDDPIELKSSLDENTIQSLKDKFKNDYIVQNKNFTLPGNFHTDLNQSIFIENYENGEMSLMPINNSSDIVCINLIFYCNFKPEQIFENIIFLYAFSCHYSNLRNNASQFNCQHFRNFDFNIMGKGNGIIQECELFIKELKSFTPSEDEILNAKKKLKETFIESTSSYNFNNSDLSFGYVLRNLPFLQDYNYLECIDRALCTPLPEWYISIQALGSISKIEARAIYEILKSTGTSALIESSKEINKKTVIKTLDDNLIEFMMACRVCNPPQNIKNEYKSVWLSLVAWILKETLEMHFYNYVRSEYPISYISNIRIEFICEQVFICFGVKSSENYEEIEKVMLDFRNEAKKIGQLTMPELKIFKEKAWNHMNEKQVSFLLKFSLLKRMDKPYIDYLDYQRDIQSELDSITKEEIENLKIFDEDPIIIHSQINN